MSGIRLSLPTITQNILEEMEEGLFMDKQNLLNLALVSLYSQYRAGEVSFKTPVTLDKP